MKNDAYRPRVLDKMVEKYLSAFGAVCIEGPKWCGKTWTSSFHSNSEVYLNDPIHGFEFRELAKMDPYAVLEGERPRLVDEWQEVPSMWDAVRFAVDRAGASGQFILTGSATPQYKGVLHSGVGRIGRLRMRPMSLFESGDSSGKVSLEAICNGESLPMQLTGEVRLQKLIELVLRGGWPGSVGKSLDAAMEIPKSYLETVFKHDIYQVDDVKRDVFKMRLLLKSLARNESTTVSNSTLARDVKERDEEDLNRVTVAEYLDVFNRLFLTDNTPPFATGIRSSARIKQMEKRHLTDTSLACALLGATPQGLLQDLNTLGFLFESLVERDLCVYAESFGGKLYHYQDYDSDEIDAVIELPNQHWCAFEVKLGAHQIDVAAANLLKISKKFEDGKKGPPPKTLCVVCGLSSAAYRRPDGVYVVPITSLKP